MSDRQKFDVTYWGTRGTVAAPLITHEVTEKIVAAVLRLAEQGQLDDLSGGAEDADRIRTRLAEQLEFHQRATYGGNTTCIEIETEDALIIVDLGTGSWRLGAELQQRWSDPNFKGARSALVLLTHGHVDHTMALPFMQVFYDPANEVHIRGAQTALECLKKIFSHDNPDQGVLYPQTLDMFQGLKFAEPITAGDTFDVGTTQVRTYALNHPGGSLGYRIEQGDKAVVIATDHEQRAVPDTGLAEFAAGADLLYADAQYLSDEYHGRVSIMDEVPCCREGWGHSYVEAVVATALEARVKRLDLGHHDPRRDDEDLHRIECVARDLMRQLITQRGLEVDCCKVHLAYDGLTVHI